MTAIPLRGDRAAWDAGNYRLLHANDIDLSASSIHHTLGTSPNQASPGDHTHDGGGGGGVASDEWYNTSAGTNAFYNFTAGSLARDNTAFGYAALYYLGNSGSTWRGNTAFGSDAGRYPDGGEYSTYLGYGADSAGNYPINSMALGANAEITKNNQVVIGDLNIEETLLRGTVILNEIGSPTWDFRAESDTNENMIFLDSSENKLYLGGLTEGIAISSSHVDIISSNFTINGSPLSQSLTTTLDSVRDVYTPAPKDGDVLTWNATSGSWIAYRAVDWRVTLTQDENTDDSDKIFTTPMGEEWQILWVWVEYTSTATAGIRQLEIQIQDAISNVIGQFQTGVTQSEGLTYKYLFAIGVPDLTLVRDGNNITTPLPAGTFLSAGQKIRVWDNNGVDASADDMVVRMQYASRNLSIEDFNPPMVINNSIHSFTSEKVTLTTVRKYTLSMKKAVQAQTSNKPLLTTNYQFVLSSVQNAAQAQTSDNIALPLQTHGLALNSSTQLQTSDNIALTQYQILAIHSSTMKSVTDKTTLSLIQHYYPVVNNTAQAQTSGSVALTFYQGVETQTSSHAQTADNTILIQQQVLAINDSIQAQTSGNVILTQYHVLSIDTATQLQTSGETMLIRRYYLVANNTTQAQTSDNIALTFYQGAETQSSSHTQTSENTIIVTNICVLKMNNAIQAQICDTITSLNYKVSLIMKNSLQAQTADKVNITYRRILAVNNSVHAQTAGSAGSLIFYQKPIGVKDSTQKIISDKVTLQLP
jgi:hypothetical protein